MGLLKWIKRELDSSNSCKRRQSEPPLSGNSSDLPRDESYVKALSKFNEWRHRQLFGSLARSSRKQNRKKLERRGQSDAFLENREVNIDEKILAKNVTTLDNSLYEEIQVNRLEQQQNNLNPPSPAGNTIEIVPIRHSYPTVEIAKAQQVRRTSSIPHGNSRQLYENALVELVNQFDRSPEPHNLSKSLVSPPGKFFKDNSNPFANVRTPVRAQEVDESPDNYIYETPRTFETLDALRATFKPLEADDSSHRSSSSNGTASRNPPYQTVINKHGEEVEYALPLNEKLTDDEDTSREREPTSIPFNSISSFQQYIEENFQFLDERERLSLSHMSASLGRNPFQRRNVLITDLDKTNATKVTDDQCSLKEPNIIQELESLEIWSRNIGENIENNLEKKVSANMHFAEIIVCNTNEVAENDPRQVFETISGTLHSGSFHCVPVTQFKPHRGQQPYGDSVLQMNYEVLRKIRHPDIALLMGITVDNKCDLDSLILEPLDFSLSHFIHELGGCIPTPVCLLYTLQINNAATYLHKHGLIHSNISTHSIVMCSLTKAVKLTSFELMTSLNGNLRDELLSVFQNENQYLDNVNQLPYKLRPYSISYRKAFSKHNHQAPELISNRFPFVFPKIQSDVYGICLTLWEMLNCSIPFAEYTYDEMTALIDSQNAQLPELSEERQKPFQQLLRVGLDVVAEKRISDTTELSEALREILLSTEEKSDESNSEDQPLSIKENSDGIPHLLSPKTFGALVYERSSTLRRRKSVLEKNHMNARQLFAYSQISKSNDTSNAMVPSHTSSPNSPRYCFEIGEVSIPETPIARSNKLRKTAWLSNQSISPIVHLEIKSKDDDAAINEIEIVENKLTNGDTSSNKLYNVNIRIRPNSKKPKTPSKASNNLLSPAETQSPGQMQKNTSQISDHIKFFNSVSQSNSQQQMHLLHKTQSPVEHSVNYNKNTTKPAPMAEKVVNRHPEPVVNEKVINEFFSRSPSVADFETSLWRREKQKCDQSVKSQRRISVKDAVNKFESFSKSMLNETSSPKPKRTLSTTTSNSDDHQAVQCANVDDGGSAEKNVSKLNIVLRNKSDDSCDIRPTPPKTAENVSECCKLSPEQKQNPMLTLNFKKLDRRASDLSSYYIRQNPKTKALTARHSIYGSEIFKRLRRAKPSAEVNEDDAKECRASNPLLSANLFQDKKKDFKIKVGKLTCLNCGHKLFVVDDVVPSSNDEDVNEAYTEMLLTPLGRNVGLQVSKSTEDFYIDDDFCEDFELCANMELGTRSQLSDFIDFDILSAEIFNPAEEKTNHLE